MSCGLTSGRTEPCKDNVAGIKAVYLFPYVKYPNSQIVGTRGSLLTSFPTTNVYKYDVQGGSFNEKIESKEDGFLVEQTLDFTLWKYDVFTNTELEKAEKIDLRYIVEFNNGKYRIGGLYNGARVDSIVLQSGGALSDLNGYNVTIKSNEKYAAPFILSLQQAGFIEFLEVDNYLLQNGKFFIFQDGEEYIFN